MEKQQDRYPTPNIIIFGESGSGKSSIINMVGQYDEAPIGSCARGVTIASTRYEVEFDGLKYNIYDTAGLDEGRVGSTPKEQAIVQLVRLLSSLDTGVNLLIFCMRGPRIKDNAYKDWRLVYEIICRRKVPIVVAITGLEEEVRMDEWWFDNKGVFQEYGMRPNGVACITAVRGRHVKSEVYRLCEESKVKMWREIKTHCLQKAWRVSESPLQWFQDVMEVRYEQQAGCWPLAFWGAPTKVEVPRTVAGAATKELVERCDMTEGEAWKLGEMLSKVCR